MIALRRPMLLAGMAVAMCQPAFAASTPRRFTAAYVGRWGEAKTGCERGANFGGGLVITPKSVDDRDFNGLVWRVQRRSPRTLYVTLQMYQYESETTGGSKKFVEGEPSYDSNLIPSLPTADR